MISVTSPCSCAAIVVRVGPAGSGDVAGQHRLHRRDGFDQRRPAVLAAFTLLVAALLRAVAGGLLGACDIRLLGGLGRKLREVGDTVSILPRTDTGCGDETCADPKFLHG
jgi:hypothetical protein